MITCTWCGTSYADFQSQCDKCGGSLPLPAEVAPAPSTETLPAPPPAPRRVPQNYARRILSADGWAIAGGIFVLMGIIFGVVGTILTITIVTAFVGIPFVGLGTVFLVAGGAFLIWRNQYAQETVEVLKHGAPVMGTIVGVRQNYQVRINGRCPWEVVYRFEVDGRGYEGKVSTMSMPDLSQQPGKPTYVLYMPGEPEQNTIYPNPYGYYGL